MNVSVLIPDGESHLLMYVINSLSQIKGVKVYVMSNDKYIPMRFSRHVHHFSYYPKTDNEKDWISYINEEIKRHNIDIVMPIFENGIEAVIKNKNEIVCNTLDLFPEYKNFEMAKNKWLLTNHLLSQDIPFPKSILFASSLPVEVENFRFPIIMKPIKGSGGGDGVCLFQNRDEFFNYLNHNTIAGEQIIQEYVKGYDIGCSVLCKDGDILAFTIQKATMLNTNPFKPLLGVKFVYEEELQRIIEKLMRSLNWSGVAHIDMKYDEEEKLFKILEVNTRFWGSLEASLMAGVNFPHLYCKTLLKEPFDLPAYNHIEYLNLKGFAKSLGKRKSSLFDLRFISKNTPVLFAVKDPIPTIFKYSGMAKHLLLRRLKKQFKVLNYF